MKAVVAAFNQEKALVGAISVITNLRLELFEALLHTSCHDQAAAAPDGELCFKQTLLINSPGGTVCQARGGLPFALGLLQLMMLSEKLKLMFTINFGEQLSWAGNSQQLEPGSCSWAAGS